MTFEKKYPGVDKKWFQSQLADKKLTQRKVGEFLGVHPSKVTHVLSGYRRAEIDEVQKLAFLIGVSSDEITRRLGIKTMAPGAHAAAPSPAPAPAARAFTVSPGMTFTVPGQGDVSITLPPGGIDAAGWQFVKAVIDVYAGGAK